MTARTALRLVVSMLRFRVAAMLWLFLLLAIARHGQLGQMSWSYLLAALGLACSYVAATTLNDIVDADIDRINHPHARGRPLVAGIATVRDMYALHVIAVVAAFAVVAPLGQLALATMGLSVAINWAYSHPWIRISHRTYLAPLVLAVAYVAVPYGLGLAAVDRTPAAGDMALLAALVLLFTSRINLKDYRDRAGDLAHGKPTLLLRWGSGVTCSVSFVALVAGDVALSAATWSQVGWVVVAVQQVLFVTIAMLLLRLFRAQASLEEQVAIAVGAQLGNGVLLIALGTLQLHVQGAPVAASALLAATLAALFMTVCLTHLSKPAEVALGYRG